MPSPADLAIADGVFALTRSPLSQAVVIEQNAGLQFSVQAVIGSGEGPESIRPGIAKTMLVCAGDFDLTENPDGTKPTAPDEKQIVTFDGRVYRIALVRFDAAIQAFDCLLQVQGRA
jgi:hypothetical protein